MSEKRRKRNCTEHEHGVLTALRCFGPSVYERLPEISEEERAKNMASKRKSAAKINALQSASRSTDGLFYEPSTASLEKMFIHIREELGRRDL